MKIDQRIEAFSTLGAFMTQFNKSGELLAELKVLNDKYYELISKQIIETEMLNPWFTKENTLNAINAIAQSLTKENLIKWTNNYPQLKEQVSPKNIGVIMAGNIPMVGFHDMLSVLIAGHSFIGKQSSKDNILLKTIGDILMDIEPCFNNHITFIEDKLQNFDAVIATGSNNSARYFEYYFGKYPHIIRKNRNSVAILTGNETKDDLHNLADDIFRYYGLGCRNVSKLYLPEGYDVHPLFQSFIPHQEVVNHNKYANNYDYNKTIYLLNNEKLLDNNFVLLKEATDLSSPIGVIYYEYYTDIRKLDEQLNLNKESIQCIVANDEHVEQRIAFGQAQNPQLWDYADNIDTIDFLTNL